MKEDSKAVTWEPDPEQERRRKAIKMIKEIHRGGGTKINVPKGTRPKFYSVMSSEEHLRRERDRLLKALAYEEPNIELGRQRRKQSADFARRRAIKPVEKEKYVRMAKNLWNKNPHLSSVRVAQCIIKDLRERGISENEIRGESTLRKIVSPFSPKKNPPNSAR